MSELNDAHRDGVVVGLKHLGVVPRRDIDVLLLEYPDTFNLLCMALLELMDIKVPWDIDEGYKVSWKDKFSWASIAGIHGLPLEGWDGVGQKPDDGYCAHGKPTFEIWHRPYLSMLEQTLYRQIQNIADRFNRSSIDQEQKTKYLEAVKQFRLPYYDYYRARNYGRMIPGVREPDILPDPKKKRKFRSRGTAAMVQIPYDFNLPQIFTLPNIMIRTLPNNEFKTMQNPFFQYKLPETLLSDEEWKKSELDLRVPHAKTKTYRYGSDKPKSVTWMNDNLNKVREDGIRIVLSMIEPGVYESFGAVTTNSFPKLEMGDNWVDEVSHWFDKVSVPLDDPKKSDNDGGEPGGDEDPPEGHDTGLAGSPSGSLEAVHNDYHVYLGGFVGKRAEMNNNTSMQGHMSCVPVSGFDPVFWIHHAQIDRLFAIWQAVNPKQWFENLPKWPNAPDYINDPLLPFRKSKSPETFWKPNDARQIVDFGYNYPDLADPNLTIDQIRTNFSNNYAWARRIIPRDGEPEPLWIPEPPADMVPLDVSGAQVYRYAPGSTEEYLFEPLSEKPSKDNIMMMLAPKVKLEKPTDGKSHEWYIDDAVERMALKGAYTIFYIIETGDIPGESGAQWTRLPGFVGLTHIFAAPPENCANCSEQAGRKQIVTSTTPISSLLMDYVEVGELQSMLPEHVKPFLTKNLKWRVQKVGGSEVDPRDLNIVISISEKVAPLPGQKGKVEYNTYRDVIQEIIKNADQRSMGLDDE